MSRAWRLIGLPTIAAGLIAALTLTPAFAMGGGYYGGYSSGSSRGYTGQIVTGPTKTQYSFTAPSQPGTYFFRCDVHFTMMTRQFAVQ